MKPGDNFHCYQCGRDQPYMPAGFPGGVTEDEARAVGWTTPDEYWLCPFCSGNEDKLHAVFKKGRQRGK